MAIDNKRLQTVRDTAERSSLVPTVPNEHSNEVLRLAKATWEQSFDSVPDLVTILDSKYRIVHINRAMAERLGTTPEQVAGLHCYEVIHGSSGPPPFCPHVRSCSDGVEHSAEFHEERLQGDFLVTTIPFLDETGQTLGSIHLARDVTQQRRAEQALVWNGRRNELLSRTAARLLQTEEPQRIIEDLCREVMDLIDCQVFFNFLLDLKTGRLRLNALGGISDEEAQQIEWLDGGSTTCACVARDGKPIIAESIQDTSDPLADLVRSYGVQAYCCHPLRVKERVIGTLSFGTRTRKRFAPEHVDVMKAVTNLVAIALDRMETETALHESMTLLKVAEAVSAERQRLYEVLETLPAYVVLLSEDYHVPFANRFFVERFGVSNGRRCYEYLFERTEACENCESYVPMKTGAPHHWQWTGPDGRDYDIYDFPFTDFDGSRLVMEMGIDVTERNRAERALRDRSEQLRALAAQLSQAEQRERKRLAKVLHDHIQQLIVAARLQVDQIRREPSPERVKTAADGADGILREALQVSRSLTIDLSPPVLHESGLIVALNWLAARMQEQHGFTVNLYASTKAEPPDEETRSLLFESVRELILNAIKHSGVSAADVTLIRPRPDEIRLIVRDEGRGFDPDAVKKRLPKEMSFGLFSIQERLVHLGGIVEIESAPDRGTQINLTVPILEAEAALAEAVHGTGSEDQLTAIRMRRKPGMCRVLIVDDHKLMREGLSGLFRFESSIEVVGEAADGAEAIDLAMKLSPDVILMDVNLGEIDGVQATRRILARNPDIKIIGLSMHTDEEMVRAMLDAGATSYVNKGEPSEDLLAAIRACTKQ